MSFLEYISIVIVRFIFFTSFKRNHSPDDLRGICKIMYPFLCVIVYVKHFAFLWKRRDIDFEIIQAVTSYDPKKDTNGFWDNDYLAVIHYEDSDKKF